MFLLCVSLTLKRPPAPAARGGPHRVVEGGALGPASARSSVPVAVRALDVALPAAADERRFAFPEEANVEVFQPGSGGDVENRRF